MNFFDFIKYKPGFDPDIFESTYFKNQKLYFKMDFGEDSSAPDDATGVLDFYATLVSSEQEYDQTVLKRFLINGFKTINDLDALEEKNKTPLLQISQASSFYSRLLKGLKKQFPNKETLDKILDGQSTKIPVSVIKPSFSNGQKNLNIFISTFNESSNLDKFNQFFTSEGKTFSFLRIFGESFTKIFLPNYGRFKFSVNKNLQQFYVKNIDFKILDTSSWNFEKNHALSFTLQIPIELEIGFYGVTKNYNGTMFASFLMSDFGY